MSTQIQITDLRPGDIVQAVIRWPLTGGAEAVCGFLLPTEKDEDKVVHTDADGKDFLRVATPRVNGPMVHAIPLFLLDAIYLLGRNPDYEDVRHGEYEWASAALMQPN